MNLKKKLRVTKLTFTIIGVFCFAMFGLTFQGCEKESLFEIQYEEYLDLETFEMSKMTVKDMETISQAIERLNISKINGLYEIEQTSGFQINISEDLFEYIKKGYEHTNKLIGPKSIDNQIPRLKSGNPEGDGSGDNYLRTDCVAHSIAHFGGSNVSYGTANSYIDSIYGGKGVPGSAMASVVSHFLPNAHNCNVPLCSDTLDNAILVIPNSWGEGHAVNATYYDAYTQTIHYYDYQNKSSGYINLSYAISLYR